MGSEKEKPDRPNNQRKDVIQRFRDSYADAINEARVSVEHTATGGWQKLYGEHKSSMRERGRELAKRIRDVADFVEVYTPGESTEKTLGDAKKTAGEISDDEAAFHAQVIDPVKRSVDECERIISEARSEAERDESRAPLVNVGLTELMKHAIGQVERVTWDAETGRVLVRFP